MATKKKPTKLSKSKKAAVKVLDLKLIKDVKGGFQEVDPKNRRGSQSAVQTKAGNAFSKSYKP